jgi:hypothetical protein
MQIRPTWRHHRIDDKPLARFAVIADSHINPHDDESTSPWEVNRLANARAMAVVNELNAIGPDFVVHLGDMIHPVPSQDSYGVAAERFWNVFGGLSMPLHLVPGNHDVGDKPLDWTPAAVVTEEYVGLYERSFGPSHYSFADAGCEFVVVNAQLINTGFPAEEEQRLWLESTLRHSDRAFLFLHYPPYVYEPGENGHYDNIDEPGHPFRPYGVTIGHLFEWARLALHARTLLGAEAPSWLLEDAQSLLAAAASRGWAVDGANRHDIRLLADIDTLHLDRGYDTNTVRAACVDRDLHDLAFRLPEEVATELAQVSGYPGVTVTSVRTGTTTVSDTSQWAVNAIQRRRNGTWRRLDLVPTRR